MVMCHQHGKTIPANTKHLPNVGTMLGQRRRRLVFTGILRILRKSTAVTQQRLSVEPMFFQRRASVVDYGPTLKQHGSDSEYVISPDTAFQNVLKNEMHIIASMVIR